MKKINLIEWLSRNSHEKQTPQRFARYAAMLIMLLTLGVGQMWGAQVTPTGMYFYFQKSDTWSPDARFAVCFQWKNGGGQDDSWYSCIQVPGESNIYYAVAPAEYWDMYFCRMQASNGTNSWDNPPFWNRSAKMQYDGTNNFFVKSTGWNEDYTYNSIYVPKANSIALSYDVVPSSGSGTSGDPYIVPTGTTVRVTAAGTSELDDPDITKKYKWDSGSYAETDYKDLECSTHNTVYSTTVSYKNYISSTTSANDKSASVYFKAVSTPAITNLTVTAGDIYSGEDDITLTATRNAAAAGINIQYQVKVPGAGSWTNLGEAVSSTTKTYSPTSGDGTYQFRAYPTGYSSYYSEASKDVYEHWNIYVHDVQSWGGVNLYMWEDGVGENDDWPGTACSKYNSTSSWYTVTLDSKFSTGFVLSNNGDDSKKTGDLTPSKVSYPANSCWYISESSGTYSIASISVTDPTVEITSATVVSGTQLMLVGRVTNCGGDGTTAADMKSVGFNIGAGDVAATCKDGTSFTKVFTGLTPGETYTVKAYAENVHGKSYSDTQDETMRSGETYTIKVRVPLAANAPYIYAFTDNSSNSSCGGTKEENTTWPGVALTSPVSGTVYKWYSYELSNEYDYFIISDDGSNKTDDLPAPESATCYWYNSSNAQASRYGTMDCPHATPQLYIETTAGGGSYNYYEMTNTSGTLSKSLALTAKSTYNFKIFYNGEYFGKGSAKATRASNGVDDLSAAVDDYVQIETDAAGSYTFEFTTGGKDLTVNYPAAHKITYGIGAINGSNSAIGATSTPSFTSGDYVLDATAVTFTKGTTKNGYHWEGWYSNNDGTGTCHSSTDANWTSAASTRSADIKVYACYSLINYNITYDNMEGATNHLSNPDTYTVEALPVSFYTPSKTGYTFNAWKAKNSSGSTVTNIAKGSTLRDTTLYASWTAKTYTITLKPNGGSGDDQSVTATFDDHAPDYDEGAKNYKFASITNPTKTGYNFEGWWTSSDAGTTLVTEIITKYKFYEWNTSYVNNSGLWQHDGNVTVYAKWTPKNYAVTLSTTGETGYGSGAPDNQTATYGAAMPTITPPVGAAGYKFMGYFLGQNGTGAQYYDASGTSVINWNIASATTLHAYFRKTEISSLEHPAAVATGETVYVVVNPVLNQEGAQPNMKICWSLLYDNDNPVESGWSVESYTEGDTKQNQVRFTLTGMSSGYYKIQAVLYAKSSVMATCDEGTELSTIKSDLRIAGNSKVTIQYEDASGNTIAASTSVEVARGDSIGVNAPSIVGYTFSEWVLGDVLSSACRDASTCALNKDSINIKAEYDGVLIAKYARKNTIYFKNTLNWPAVYVNLLDAGYWNENGSGNNGHSNRNLEMTRLGESDIWYYEYDGKTATDYVSFTSVVQNGTGYGAGNFWGADTAPEESKVRVVYPTRPNYDNYERTAYGFNVNTPMFVPLAGQTAKEMNVNAGGRAYYYNQGYWAKYEPVSKETGYTLKIYNKKNSSDLPDKDQAPVEIKSIPFTFSGDMTFPVHITTDLETSKTYGFKIYRADGVWFRNGGTMTNGHSGDVGQKEWEFGTESGSNCGLTTTSAGNYTFTLDFNSSGNHQVGVHYPESTGDFRVMYTDDVRIENHDSNEGKSWLLSSVIPGNTASDTISYFVRAEGGKNPKYKIQKCTVSEEAREEDRTVSWADQGDAIEVPDSITRDSVYNFIFTKDNSGNLVLEKIEPYEGNFYIRTDGATPSKWDNYRQSNHLMAYSEYADKHENFTHSYTQWYDLTNRKNLKFTVANDYSVSISDTLTREALSGQWTNIDDYIDENGDLNRQANVRFMYNQKTNAISRAYIDGAYEAGGNFLKILARTQDSIYAAAEGGDPLTEITFTDNGNWLYEQTVFAQPGARYKLRSLFGETGGGKEIITQYFKGNEGSTAADSATMIGGDGSSRMQIRLLYDFKTNRVVTAYQPAGTIDENLAIHADIMFMREHQEDIEQITFAEDKSISEIENIYCGLRFNKWTLNNRSKEGEHPTLSPLLSRYERDIFYVSFPYDVRLSDVIGFGTYGQHWIVEYYDGAARAKNGFWIDSDSYWKFVTPAMKDTFTLKAGTGYIVALDLDELYYIDGSHHASIWNNTDISDLELLFPGNVSSISNIDVTYNMPSHECKINRGTTAGNRTIKDSHWNVLGVPTFKNITGQASGEPDEGVGSGAIVFDSKAWVKDSLKLKFIYDGNLADNSLTPKAVKDFEFKAMHAYVVQYCGDVTFTTSATPAPSPIVARRTYAEKPRDIDFRLELTKNGVMEDQTFISLSNDENVSAGFAFGEDLSKEFNTNRANIYTFIGTEWVAGNTLPMINQTTIVPVGVNTNAAGEYTFSMPEGTDGVGVVLIDNIADTRTNLGLMDYSVTLEQGQIDNRFVLEISPVRPISTDLEDVTGDESQVTGARKVLIDGIMYIVRDGKVFDARGNRVK